MATMLDRSEALENVRVRLFIVGKRADRLADATKELEELYARRKKPINPDDFDVTEEPDSKSPEWARRSRKRTIDAVVAVRAGVEEAIEAVAEAAAHLDTPYESVDQRWSTRIVTDLRALRSEILREQSLDDPVSLLPLPGIGVPDAIRSAIVPVRKHMLAVKSAKRVTVQPAPAERADAQWATQGRGNLKSLMDKSERNRLLSRIHTWARYHHNDLAGVVDRVASRFTLEMVNQRIARKEPIYGGFRFAQPIDPTSEKPGIVAAWRINMVVGEILAHPPALTVDALGDLVGDALHVIAIICLLTDAGAGDYMDWDLAKVPYEDEPTTGMGRGWNVWKDADCPYWPKLEPLAAAAIDLLDVPAPAPESALRLLGMKSHWPITRLPLGVTLDVLRQLDQRGWIEAAEVSRQSAPTGSQTPLFAPSHWASPMREGSIHGTWQHLWSKRSTSDWERPAVVRLRDAGWAALSEISAKAALGRDVPGAAHEPTAKPPTKFAAAEDFTWIVWNGQKYDFAKGNQAESIRALWCEWEKSGRLDGCGLSEKTIGEKCGSSSNDFRLAKVFLGHAAWGSVIRTVSKGVFALFAESPQNPTS